MSGSKKPCGSMAQPHGVVYARRYLPGWRCDRHTPAAVQGKPEPPPGPGWPKPDLSFPPSTPDPSAETEEPSP